MRLREIRIKLSSARGRTTSLKQYGKSQSGCLLNLSLKTTAFDVAEPTGLEPATSDVTGRRSNQLNYDSG